jgi:hypothetical protein
LPEPDTLQVASLGVGLGELPPPPQPAINANEMHKPKPQACFEILLMCMIAPFVTLFNYTMVIDITLEQSK